MKNNKNIVLTEKEYCHVINRRSGKVKLIEGPCRLSLLNPFKKVLGSIHGKEVLTELECAIILNPYNKKKKELEYGEILIKRGPAIFSLHHNEKLDNKIAIKILSENRGLRLIAKQNFMDGDVQRKSGEQWLIEGPTTYEPHKYVKIVSEISKISLQEHSGVYVQNSRTGDIRLEKGPQSLTLKPHEDLWEKEYTQSERDAINLGNYKSHEAFPLWVLENEITKIMSENSQEIVFGPKVILLNPHERPYIMTIAGGTPKNTQRIKIWKIKIGPNFSTDIVDVRTKDNAVLKIKLRYQWKFMLDDDIERIFSIADFVGLMTEMMAGIIRNEAAKHDFEVLHSKATEIVKQAIFNGKEDYEFDNGLNVFGVDIKEITPKDKEIAERMNEAIKSNMNIYVDKMKQVAEIEAKKTKIEGQKVIEAEITKLIEIENENLKKREMIQSQIEAEKNKIRAISDAERVKIAASAEAEAIELKTEATIKAVKDEIEALKDGENYIKLKQAEGLNSVKKMVIVPTDSKIWLPTDLLNIE